MNIPEYITKQEVGRVCKELGLRNWSAMKKPKVTIDEARIILRELDTGGMAVDDEQFRAGLEVELEHGVMFPEANVTNNHPLLTGKIVIAHFKETLDYYKRLEVAELEGDLLKAIRAGKTDKIRSYYKRLTDARLELSKSELADLKKGA
ncbi:MAG TPA: DUF5661 family protein [Dissulfurispiraceae bacterium]|nr:DUF5661 family protein [Dissulfurispiraceae bacterium]